MGMLGGFNSQYFGSTDEIVNRKLITAPTYKEENGGIFGWMNSMGRYFQDRPALTAGLLTAGVGAIAGQGVPGGGNIALAAGGATTQGMLDRSFNERSLASKNRTDTTQDMLDLANLQLKLKELEAIPVKAEAEKIKATEETQKEDIDLQLKLRNQFYDEGYKSGLRGQELDQYVNLKLQGQPVSYGRGGLFSGGILPWQRELTIDPAVR